MRACFANKVNGTMKPAKKNSMGSALQTDDVASQLRHNALAAQNGTTQISSAEQGHGERDTGNQRSSRAFTGDYSDLLHELANITTAVLINAQLLGWKLPPYSRLKRPVREIERNAQRSAELMKRLSSRLTTDRAQSLSQESGPGFATVTAQEPGVASGNAVKLPPRMSSRPAPDFFSGLSVTSQRDVMAALVGFPKRDDGNEY